MSRADKLKSRIGDCVGDAMANTKNTKHERVYDFKVLLEPDEEAGGYVVICPSLPGCYSQGDSVEEALENIREAILLTLEDLRAQKSPIPDPNNTLIGSVLVSA